MSMARRSNRAVSQLQGGRTRRQADQDHQHRRCGGAGGGFGERRAGNAGARGVERLQDRAQLFLARRQAGRCVEGQAERSLCRGVEDHRGQAGIRSHHGVGLSPRRPRDRQPASGLVWRHRLAGLDRGRRGAGKYRIPRRPLHRRHRPRRRRQGGVHGGLCGAGGIAGQIRAAAGRCRGHVQPLALWPHRHRLSRGASGEMSASGRKDSPSCPGLSRASTSVPVNEEDVDGRDKPGHDGVKKRRTVRIVAFSFAIIASVTIAIGAWVVALGPLPLAQARQVSTTIVDRNGKLLRAYAMADGRWRLPVDARTGVDPSYLKLLLAYEDRRFYSHAGVDPLALGRAAFQLVTRGQIVSGGSTITMQLARLMEPRRERSVYAKLRQMVRALQIERQLDKNQILDLYLALAPFGGNLEGVRAASIAYFGKEPKRLSLAESALLVALPQSPETRRLDRYPEAARAVRDRVLDRMVEDGRISEEDASSAKAVPVPRLRKPMPILAPHSADQAIAAVKDASVIALTLDAGLQKALEALARDRAIALGPNISVAIIAVDNATGDVLARIGSPDYFDDRRAGQVDMTRAVRSPGSTLKPFIYGLAFEDGFVHPESLIDDRPVRFGSYAPENFDMTFQGTVPVRKALQMSLNVPAVALLDRVGASRRASPWVSVASALRCRIWRSSIPGSLSSATRGRCARSSISTTTRATPCD